MTVTPLQSLVTNDEADAYAALHAWPDADFADLDDEVKDARLIEASTFVLTGWRWPRGTYYASDATVWPYSSVVINGVTVATIPANAKAAVMEIVRLLKDGPLAGGAQAPAIKQKTIGPITKIYQDRDVAQERTDRLAWVSQLLASTGAIATTGSVNVRIRRA